MRIDKVSIVIESAFGDNEKQDMLRKVMETQIALSGLFDGVNIEIAVMRERQEEDAPDIDGSLDDYLDSLGLIGRDDCQCSSCQARRFQRKGGR